MLGVPIHASLAEAEGEIKKASISVSGNLDKLISEVDVMADCTPKGIAAKNLEKYKTAGVKAIVQGGEKHSVTGHSFVAQAHGWPWCHGERAASVTPCIGDSQ